MFTNLKFVNLTQHPIVVENDSVQFTIEPSGTIARVATEMKEVKPGFFTTIFGEVEGIPAPEKDTLYVVSAMVLSGTNRDDVVAPASGLAKRNEKGFIISVPGFVINS